jgi:uncharacterized protein (UPF0548 family)
VGRAVQVITTRKARRRCQDAVMIRSLSYDAVGLTCAGDEVWTQHPAGYRRRRRTVSVGHGSQHWDAAVLALLGWQVKTRSGFVVEPMTAGVRVQEQADYRLVARVGPVTVREPVRVVAVVDRPTRCGFAYGTLEGHPVSGEEAFIVHRTVDGENWLTVRSLTRASRGGWRWAFPFLLVAQAFYRRRYLRALRPG